jgi:hypothetical protein
MRKRRLIIAFAVVALVGVFVALPPLKRHAELVNCSNQMHVILVAATLMWPEEHNGHLPSDFLSMSNELGTPKILLCASDHSHRAAPNWNSFTTNNCSYEIMARGVLDTETNRIFMRCRIHGFVGYADDRLLTASGRLVKPARLW